MYVRAAPDICVASPVVGFLGKSLLCNHRRGPPIPRGIFGSQIALLIRWLRSICRYYNSVPQFILSSATIGGAQEFVGTITGVAVSEIVETTAHPEHSRRYGSIILGLREKEVLPRLLISYAINGKAVCKRSASPNPATWQKLPHFATRKLCVT